MSAELYPPEVWQAFTKPNWLLPPEAEAAARLLGRARSPAAPVEAALYEWNGAYYWRARGCPWLIALAEALCKGLNAGEELQQIEKSLIAMDMPPVKRYCAVMARELLTQQSVEALE